MQQVQNIYYTNAAETNPEFLLERMESEKIVNELYIDGDTRNQPNTSNMKSKQRSSSEQTELLPRENTGGGGELYSSQLASTIRMDM